MRIERLKEVDSTNRYIERYLGGGEDVIVTADRQTGGRGTKGRSFLSEAGGVYLSALTFYRELYARDAFSVMTHAAVSVCRVAERFGVQPEIKWPNDVLVNGKKLCGILIENTFSGGKVKCSIVGIGLNVNNDVSALGGIAVNLSSAAGHSIPTEDVREALIVSLAEKDGMSEYLAHIHFLGKQVTVCEGDRSFLAFARRITEDGRLEIGRDGQTRILSAAEISLRF